MLNFRNYGRLWRVYGRSIVGYGSFRKLWNAFLNELAYQRRQENVKSRPYLLFVEPLYLCNLQCPLCDRQKMPNDRAPGARKLSLAIYDKVLDELGDYLLQCHIFGLGEPLIDWGLTREVIRRAHRRRIFTLVSTNCTLVTDDIAAEAVSSGLDYLVCAIDGVSQESYAKYRIGGKVHDALAGLERFCRAREKAKSPMQIEWQFLVHRYNVHELEEAREIARNLEVFIRFAPIGGVEWNPLLQEYWLPDSRAAWQESRLSLGEVRNSFHCYWLWRGAVLNSDGNVARCPGYQNRALIGNLNRSAMMDLYNGASSRRARQLFRRAKVPEGPFPEPCVTCNYYRREHG